MNALTNKIGAVRVQDLVLTTLCILFIYLFRSKEYFELQPEWRRHLDEHLYRNSKYPSREEKLPRPIVTDFEGDGVLEIIFITNGLELQVAKYHRDLKDPSSKQLPHLEVEHSVKLPSVKDEDGGQGFPVAIETGYIDKYQSMVQIRSQVIIVVLDDWVVLCYNSTLGLQWQQKLMDTGQMRENYVVVAMGILVAPTPLKPEDQGLVIVGGAFGHKDHDGRMRKLPSDNGGGHMHQSGNLHQGVDDPATHFSTFALSGNDGSVRWHHLPGDFEAMKQQNRKPSHHWKLDLNQKHWHVGEAHWSKFGSNLLKHMPHQWSSLYDTKFDLANIKKLEQAPPSVNSDALPTPLIDILPLDHEHIPGFSYGGHRPHSRHEHVHNPNAVVIHSHRGLEVLSLETGQPLTRLRVDDHNVVSVDVNEDGTLEQVVATYSEDECLAQVFTVQPYPRAIFSSPICDNLVWGSEMILSTSYQVAEDVNLALAPVVVKSIAKRRGIFNHLLGGNLRSERKGYDSIFVTSQGRVTSYGPQGELNWQVLVSAQWASMTLLTSVDASSSEAEVYHNAFTPSAMPLSPKVFGAETALLILGWDTMSLVDLRDGHTLVEHSLPCQPINKPVIADFTEDGRNDVIITCPSGGDPLMNEPWDPRSHIRGQGRDPRMYIGFSLHPQTPYVYTTIVSVTVVLSILMLSWCCRPEKEGSEHSFDVH